MMAKEAPMTTRNVSISFQRSDIAPRTSAASGLVLVGEIVAHLPFREDKLRFIGVALNLLAQAADVHVHRAQIA